MSYRDTQEDNYIQQLLANAVESDMQNDEEREYLRKYQKTLQNLKREQKELSKIKRRIKELSTQEGTTNTATIDELKESAQDISTLIHHYKKHLLKLESTPPLSCVVERKSVEAYLKEKEKEAEEILARYDEQRQETSQNKESPIESQTHRLNSSGIKKIRKLIKELRREKTEIFQALAYIGTTVCYGVVLGIIADADIGLFPTILLFIGVIVLGFFTWIGLHEAFSKDD